MNHARHLSRGVFKGDRLKEKQIASFDISKLHV